MPISRQKLNRLIGQKTLKEQLKDSMLDGSPLNHAYLFYGEEGMGKRSFALAFAQEILCLNNKSSSHASEEDASSAACGKCLSCQYFNAGTHPDFKIVDRGKDKLIKLDRLRQEVISDLGILPQLSPYKVYLFSLDDLNEQGQNALLKSLEEPPEHVVFLLTCRLLDKLLDTIVSRVRILKLQPYSRSELKQILEQSTADRASLQDLEFSLTLAKGNPGRALQIASDPQYKEMRQEAVDLFFSFPTATRTTLLTEVLAGLTRQKDQIDFYLGVWQELLHDSLILLQDVTIENISQLDLRDRLKRLVSYYIDKSDLPLEERKDKIIEALAALAEVSKASQVNASFDGMIGQLLLTLRKDLYIDGKSN